MLKHLRAQFVLFVGTSSVQKQDATTRPLELKEGMSYNDITEFLENVCYKVSKILFTR